MRFPSYVTGPLLATSVLFGRGAFAQSGIAGAIDNASQAALLQGVADLLTEGNYIIKNVQTGEALTYTAVGNHIVPASGAGTPVAVSHYSSAVSWLRLQIGSKNKCLSAQWGGSYDHAGVMYECAVFGNGAVKADNTLEPTKQWWLLVPVGASSSGGSDSSNQLLAAAQQDSVDTRENALKSGKTTNPFAHSKRILKRVAAHAKRARHPKAVSSKKKTSSKSKSTKSSSKSKSTSSAAAPVKLDVASTSSSSSQKYYIIAVDHLIDMHTMALVGQSMATAGNTQSTALAVYSPSDTLQQWIVTPA